MRRFNLVVLLAFASGCSGGQFSTAGQALDAAEADAATGGAPSTGGAPGSGGSSGRATGGMVATGGAPELDAGNDAAGGASQGTGGSSQNTGGSFQETGGSSQTGGAPATGGAPVTGGAPNTGGVAVDACALVTHDNGLGGAWQDCVPLGTYDLEQAMKACKASGAASCTKSMGCGGNNETVYGLTLGSFFAHWGYGSVNAGYVNDASVCPHDGDPRWN